MFSRAKKTTDADDLLAEKSNVEGLRAQRVWLLAKVSWLTWLFFTGYCLFRGHSLGAVICFLEVVGILVMIEAHKGKANYRRVMNVTLGLSATGLVFVSSSAPALHQAMLFFPVSILIASQLLGTRAAFHWLVVSLLANTMFFFITDGFSDARVDERIMVYGVAVCVFFCCQQGEAFYRARTRGLVDLSQRLQAKSQRLHRLATTDSLTGLVNRFQFQRDLEDAVEVAYRNAQRMALLLIDMDGFKEINDTLGHPVGDQALIEIADRLRQEFNEDVLISRLGGDEFCLICPEVGSVEQAAMIAQRAYNVLTQRYMLDECEFPLGTSVGFALCPDHTESDTDLLAYADTAMFFAKENRLAYARYEPDMTKRLLEYRTMQEQLACALERNEFFLVYQPQVCLATGRTIGVEALLRWRRDGEVISPERFIPLLEKSHEIIPVGRWVIRESCRQLRNWTDAGYDVAVSINVSVVQFNDDGFYSSIVEPINELDLDACKLDFEITESLLVDDVSQAVERLVQVRELGASISIDDFGTGYSSLAYLREFPLDRLKIDRAFVKGIPDSDDGVIAQSIVALAKAIGLKVLAEGVETPEQLEFLQALDCDEYQGYFFSRPVSAEEVTEFLTKASSVTSNAIAHPVS